MISKGVNLIRQDTKISVGLSMDNNTCGIYIENGDKHSEEEYFIPGKGRVNQFPHIIIASWTFCPVQKISAKVIFGAIKTAGVVVSGSGPIINTSLDTFYATHNPDTSYYLDIPRSYVGVVIEIIRKVVKGLSIFEISLDAGTVIPQYTETIKTPQMQREASLKIAKEREFLKTPSSLIMGKNINHVHNF